ncbi:MAG: hypothetical protein OEZ34_16445, partial [Spirochaetia bacterium]|nr:hypothetical protein [Spirochaetia bacterium]
MKFQSGDIKVLFTAGAVLFLSGYLLYQDFSSTPSCCRNSVIANVLFTGGTVQKKSVSDYIWHSLLTDMQIHSHDTVKTNSDSEITISIDKGIQIELDSQTRVSFLRNRKNDIELDFKEGSIFLENNSENTRVTVSHDKNKISAGRGLFRFAVINTGLYISCIQGFAELKPAAGGRKQIFAGQTKVLSEKGIAQRNLYLDLHPVDNAHLYLKDSQSINFRWMQQEALLEVSKEKNFSNPIFFQEVDSSQIRLKMDYGIYYWRIRTEDNQVSQFHKLLVLPEEKTLIRTPEPETAFLTSQNYSTVDFLWKGNTQAEYYRLEISEDENFSRKVYDEKIFRNGISIKLPINIYYWRISAIHNHTTINITQPRY